MLPRHWVGLFATAGLFVCVTVIFSEPSLPDDGIFDQTKVEIQVADRGQEGIEQQARGPVHEAFASPATATAPQPQPLVPNAPPTPVEEMPPDQKPEGNNVHWLSGYWHYDPEAKDFLW